MSGQGKARPEKGMTEQFQESVRESLTRVGQVSTEHIVVQTLVIKLSGQDAVRLWYVMVC